MIYLELYDGLNFLLFRRLFIVYILKKEKRWDRKKKKSRDRKIIN